jgi:predicted NBD/HSP70 family sugar kinase
MKRYLALDIGGSSIKYALMEKEKIQEKGSVRTPDTSLEDFLDVLYEVKEKFAKEKVIGVAISMPGLIDSEKGYAEHGGSLGYIRKIPIRTYIEKKLGLPVSIENDGKAAVLGEAWKGQLKNEKDGVMLVLGTGVGGGIISNGELVKGKHFGAGEFSFIRTNGETPLARKDMFGRKASTINLVKRAAELLGEDSETFTGQRLMQEVKFGNEQAQSCLYEYASFIAGQLFTLQTILDPEVIVIGGGISADSYFVKYIEEAVKELVDKDYISKISGYYPKVVQSELGNDANLYGALFRLLEQQESQ